MDPNSYEDRYEVSQSVWYSRALAYNAHQLHYYERHLENARTRPQVLQDDIDYMEGVIELLYAEREELSKKYMKAVSENK